MKNFKFQNKQEIENEVIIFLQLEFFFLNKNCIYKFVTRWTRIIKCNGDYFNKLKMQRILVINN